MPDEIVVAEKDSAQVTDQTSIGKKESTSKPPELTPEVKKAISDALAEQGRKYKAELEPIKQERDNLKTEVEQARKEAHDATRNLESTKSKIADLESDLAQAIGDDADLLDINNIKKELRAERDRARQEAKDERDAVDELRRTTEAERLEWAETVAEAQTYKFDGELALLADEYEGIVTDNFTKLKAVCVRAGIKTKEGAEAIAETFLTKKVEEPNLLEDPGTTNGGRDDINSLPVQDRIKILNERALKKIKV